MGPIRRQFRIRVPVPQVRRWIRQGLLGLGPAVLLMLTVAASTDLSGPLRAQSAEPATASAPVLLDGRTLFRIWGSRNLTAEQRSSTVNLRISLPPAIEAGLAALVERQRNEEP